MSTIELRNKVIERVRIMDDYNILKDIFRILEIGGNDDDREVYVLSETQKKIIALSRKQIKEGKSFTNDEVNRETEEWLGK
jgi:hypothetical protein